MGDITFFGLSPSRFLSHRIERVAVSSSQFERIDLNLLGSEWHLGAQIGRLGPDRPPTAKDAGIRFPVFLT
jgi:hypothetical protein